MKLKTEAFSNSSDFVKHSVLKILPAKKKILRLFQPKNLKSFWSQVSSKKPWKKILKFFFCSSKTQKQLISISFKRKKILQRENRHLMENLWENFLETLWLNFIFFTSTLWYDGAAAMWNLQLTDKHHFALLKFNYKQEGNKKEWPSKGGGGIAQR